MAYSVPLGVSSAEYGYGYGTGHAAGPVGPLSLPYAFQGAACSNAGSGSAYVPLVYDGVRTPADHPLSAGKLEYEVPLGGVPRGASLHATVHSARARICAGGAGQPGTHCMGVSTDPCRAARGCALKVTFSGLSRRAVHMPPVVDGASGINRAGNALHPAETPPAQMDARAVQLHADGLVGGAARAAFKRHAAEPLQAPSRVLQALGAMPEGGTVTSPPPATLHFHLCLPCPTVHLFPVHFLLDGSLICRVATDASSAAHCDAQASALVSAVHAGVPVTVHGVQLQRGMLQLHLLPAGTPLAHGDTCAGSAVRKRSRPLDGDPAEVPPGRPSKSKGVRGHAVPSQTLQHALRLQTPAVVALCNAGVLREDDTVAMQVHRNAHGGAAPCRAQATCPPVLHADVPGMSPHEAAAVYMQQFSLLHTLQGDVLGDVDGVLQWEVQWDSAFACMRTRATWQPAQHAHLPNKASSTATISQQGAAAKVWGVQCLNAPLGAQDAQGPHSDTTQCTSVRGSQCAVPACDVLHVSPVQGSSQGTQPHPLHTALRVLPHAEDLPPTYALHGSTVCAFIAVSRCTLRQHTLHHTCLAHFQDGTVYTERDGSSSTRTGTSTGSDGHSGSDSSESFVLTGSPGTSRGAVGGGMQVGGTAVRSSAHTRSGSADSWGLSSCEGDGEGVPSTPSLGLYSQWGAGGAAGASVDSASTARSDSVGEAAGEDAVDDSCSDCQLSNEVQETPSSHAPAMQGGRAAGQHGSCTQDLACAREQRMESAHGAPRVPSHRAQRAVAAAWSAALHAGGAPTEAAPQRCAPCRPRLRPMQHRTQVDVEELKDVLLDGQVLVPLFLPATVSAVQATAALNAQLRELGPASTGYHVHLSEDGWASIAVPLHGAFQAVTGHRACVTLGAVSPQEYTLAVQPLGVNGTSDTGARFLPHGVHRMPTRCMCVLQGTPPPAVTPGTPKCGQLLQLGMPALPSAQHPALLQTCGAPYVVQFPPASHAGGVQDALSGAVVAQLQPCPVVVCVARGDVTLHASSASVPLAFGLHLIVRGVHAALAASIVPGSTCVLPTGLLPPDWTMGPLHVRVLHVHAVAAPGPSPGMLQEGAGRSDGASLHDAMHAAAHGAGMVLDIVCCARPVHSEAPQLHREVPPLAPAALEVPEASLQQQPSVRQRSVSAWDVTEPHGCALSFQPPPQRLFCATSMRGAVQSPGGNADASAVRFVSQRDAVLPHGVHPTHVGLPSQGGWVGPPPEMYALHADACAAAWPCTALFASVTLQPCGVSLRAVLPTAPFARAALQQQGAAAMVRCTPDGSGAAVGHSQTHPTSCGVAVDNVHSAVVQWVTADGTPLRAGPDDLSVALVLQWKPPS